MTGKANKVGRTRQQATTAHGGSGESGEWSRRRLQVALAAGIAVAVGVLAGLGWWATALVSHHGEAATPSNIDAPSAVNPDPAKNARPGPLSTARAGSIQVPQPTTIGPAEVGTGFPQTDVGALGQLIAIDERALDSASVVVAQDIIAAWAAPGGPTPETWSGVAAARELLDASGLPANGSPDLTVQLEPAMGLLRRPAAPDPTVLNPTVCVDFIVTATLTTGTAPTRVAASDCQTMTWQDGRWVIAPGPEAAPMPSLWPGTQASYDAGYQWLEIQP